MKVYRSFSDFLLQIKDFLRVIFSLASATCIEEVLTLKCSASSFRYASRCFSMYCCSFCGLIFLLRDPCFFWLQVTCFLFLGYQLL